MSTVEKTRTSGPRVNPGPWVNRVLLLNLVVQSGIVLTGGLVRLTGSGLGCPTWPECVPGSYTPVVEQAEGINAYIEWGNRMLTFVVALAALATAVAVWRTRRDRRLRVLALVPGLGVIGQAALGGVTVLTGLDPATVAAHFLLSMVLVAASTALLLRARQPDGPSAPVVRHELRSLAAAIAAVAAIVLVLGTVVTGSGPHSGDIDTPRFQLDPRAMSWLHADAVLVFVGLVVAMLLALRLVDAPPRPRRAARWLFWVTLAQGLVGYVQYLTDLPEALVALHMVGACALTVAVTALVMSLRERTAVAGPTPPDAAVQNGTNGSTAMATNSTVR